MLLGTKDLPETMKFQVHASILKHQRGGVQGTSSSSNTSGQTEERRTDLNAFFKESTEARFLIISDDIVKLPIPMAHCVSAYFRMGKGLALQVTNHYPSAPAPRHPWLLNGTTLSHYDSWTNRCVQLIDKTALVQETDVPQPLSSAAQLEKHPAAAASHCYCTTKTRMWTTYSVSTYTRNFQRHANSDLLSSVAHAFVVPRMCSLLCQKHQKETQVPFPFVEQFTCKNQNKIVECITNIYSLSLVLCFLCFLFCPNFDLFWGLFLFRKPAMSCLAPGSPLPLSTYRPCSSSSSTETLC